MKMRLNIVTLSGESFTVETDAGASIEDLKAEIAYTQKLVIDQIKLLVNSRAITSGSVGSNGLRDGHTVHMVLGEVVNISISVNLPNGSRERLEVEPSEQIVMLKQKIQAKFGYRVDDAELVFEGKTIEGGRLSHHRIKNGSTIALKLKKIRVTFTRMGTENFNLELDPHMTIEDLKKKLQTKTGVRPDQQRLLHRSGNELTEGKLHENGIGTGSVIDIVLRLRGG